MKQNPKLTDVQKRILKLPQLFPLYMNSILKRNALVLIKNFHDGIKANAFSLTRLEKGTIERKRRMHMAKPKVPLYGKGDDKKDNSYVNMFRIKKLKNGWRVYPSWGKHWSGNVELRKLLHVHEYGAILKNQHGLIRIPPRPALARAYKKSLENLKKDSRSKQYRAAIDHYIRTGNQAKLHIEPINMLKPYKEIERRASGR